jgi:hypothetical protein
MSVGMRTGGFGRPVTIKGYRMRDWRVPLPFDQGLQTAKLSVNPAFAAAAVGFSVGISALRIASPGRISRPELPRAGTLWNEPSQRSSSRTRLSGLVLLRLCRCRELLHLVNE